MFVFTPVKQIALFIQDFSTLYKCITLYTIYVSIPINMFVFTPVKQIALFIQLFSRTPDVLVRDSPLLPTAISQGRCTLL